MAYRREVLPALRKTDQRVLWAGLGALGALALIQIGIGIGESRYTRSSPSVQQQYRPDACANPNVSDACSDYSGVTRNLMRLYGADRDPQQEWEADKLRRDVENLKEWQQREQSEQFLRGFLNR